MSVETTPTSPFAAEPDGSAEHPSGRVLEVSDAALQSVLAIRAEEPDPASLGLRVEITGSRGSEYTYDLSFEELSAVGDDHVRYEVDELTVVIPNASVENLQGAELDLPRNAGQGGLVIRNPNRPNPLAGVELELEGDIAQKVTQLLDGSINPALASHGGYASLVGVDDDDNVYVTMGGGCQGCAASAATLRDGIRRSIKDAIPEVADVIDATDHAAGENPFYT